MDPDQTADMGPYCLQYRLLENVSRREKIDDKSPDRQLQANAAVFCLHFLL